MSENTEDGEHTTGKLLRCDLCRRTHSKGRNHVYSSNHVANVRKVLAKFGLKIKNARTLVDSPVIREDTSVSHSQILFWCYFCSKEFPRHFTFDNQFYLEEAGLLEHITSTRHLLMVKAFWRKNRVHSRGKRDELNKQTAKTPKTGFLGDQKLGKSIMQDYCKDMRKNYRSDVETSSCWKEWLKRQKKVKAVDDSQPAYGSERSVAEVDGKETESPKTPMTKREVVVVDWTVDHFILQELDWQRFQLNAKRCIDSHFTRRDQQLQQDADSIAECAKKRAHLMNIFQRQMSNSRGLRNHSQEGELSQQKQIMAKSSGSVRTVSAYGEGLTYIGIPKVDDSVGNVHSGAPPPWLQSSCDDKLIVAASVIGPTADDFKKHLENQKKLKLPAGRVGANFNHRQVGISDLPSFGGVWSKNRRSHQQAGFKRVLYQRGNRGAGRGNRRAAESAAATCVATFGDGSNSDFNRRFIFDGSEPSVHGLPPKRREPVSSNVGLPVPSDFTITDSGVPKCGVYQPKRPASVRSGHGTNVNPEVGGTRLKIAPNLL